jgi:hypothetical protein
MESPVYAILGMTEKLDKMKSKRLRTQWTVYGPNNQSDFTVKWDGEWQITLKYFVI